MTLQKVSIEIVTQNILKKEIHVREYRGKPHLNRRKID